MTTLKIQTENVNCKNNILIQPRIQLFESMGVVGMLEYSQHHAKTIHPTGKFISIKFLQFFTVSCMVIKLDRT